MAILVLLKLVKELVLPINEPPPNTFAPAKIFTSDTDSSFCISLMAILIVCVPFFGEIVRGNNIKIRKPPIIATNNNDWKQTQTWCLKIS